MKNQKKHLDILIVLCCIILVACSMDETERQNVIPGNEKPKTGIMNRTINYDALEREYVLYVPDSYSGDKPVPLLFNFHGYNSTAEQLLEYADFRPIADKAGFILVYPQGSLLEGKTHWNVGGWTTGSTTDDVGFTKAMIDDLSSEYNIDLSRVYAVGHSNGGYMSLRLACDLSEKIAAIVSVSGSMTTETLSSCDPKRPISVMQIHGTSDKSISYNGANWTLSIDDLLYYWVTKNGCNQTPITDDLPHNPNTTSNTSVERIKYIGCKSGVTVEHYKYIGGGHEWPGALDELGQSNVDLNITDEIWAFLSRYSLDGINE